MEKKHLGAILYVAKEPLSVTQISKLVDEEEKVILRWLFELQNDLKNLNIGITIRQVAGGFEMVTSDDCFEAVEKIAPKEYEKVPRSVLETVTIVAYNQPATRSMIKKFRGVKDPEYGITSSLERKLIKETEEGYITTDQFLKYFGINDIKELPNVAIEQTKKEEAEE